MVTPHVELSQHLDAAQLYVENCITKIMLREAEVENEIENLIVRKIFCVFSTPDIPMGIG